MMSLVELVGADNERNVVLITAVGVVDQVGDVNSRDRGGGDGPRCGDRPLPASTKPVVESWSGVGWLAAPLLAMVVISLAPLP